MILLLRPFIFASWCSSPKLLFSNLHSKHHINITEQNTSNTNSSKPLEDWNFSPWIFILSTGRFHLEYNNFIIITLTVCLVLITTWNPQIQHQKLLDSLPVRKKGRVSEGSQEPKNRTKIRQKPKNRTKPHETANRRNVKNRKNASKFWENRKTAQGIASNRKTANLWHPLKRIGIENLTPTLN